MTVFEYALYRTACQLMTGDEDKRYRLYQKLARDPDAHQQLEVLTAISSTIDAPSSATLQVIEGRLFEAAQELNRAQNAD